MTLEPKQLVVLALGLALLPMAGDAQLQSVPVTASGTNLLPAAQYFKSGTNFSAIQYFEFPNEQQMKVRMSGAGMVPLPGALLDISDINIEKYSLSGRLEATVQAPHCVYAPMDGTASSPGHLRLSIAGEKIRVEGDGFLWRQKDDSLDISNNVSTVIKTGSWSLSTP